MDDGAATPPRASCSHTCASPPMPIRGCAHVRSKPSMSPTPTATPPSAIGEEEPPRRDPPSSTGVVRSCSMVADGAGRDALSILSREARPPRRQFEMGLLTIIKKVKAKEREMRLLMVCVAEGRDPRPSHVSGRDPS